MKTITIRQLHEATGKWVRHAAAGEVQVTERGRLVARIVPARAVPARPYFSNPRWTAAFLRNRKHLRGGADTTELISEERGRSVP